MAPPRLPDLATRLQGLAVAPHRPRWIYASLANLRRGVGPTHATTLALCVHLSERVMLGNRGIIRVIGLSQRIESMLGGKRFIRGLIEIRLIDKSIKIR